MFEDSTFESQGRIHTRSKGWMVATFGLNGSIVAALILIPLIYTSALPPQTMPFLMTTPEAPRAAVVIHRMTARASTSAARNILDELRPPMQIPPRINFARDSGPGGRIALDNGDSTPGTGTIGGVGDEPFHRTSPPVVHSEPKTIRVSSGTEEGMILFKTLPQYPVIARTMRAEGTVVLAATISKAGTIENLRAVSGPAVLQQAAIDAVKTWRYRPYMLDGQPVEVETNVNVAFRIER